MDSHVAPDKVPFQSKKYEWIEYLGGNMADVYLAREIRTERQIIVKVLKSEYCKETELQQRFSQEARLACQCRHPNIVTTYYADEEEGRPYIAMEHLGGETIREMIQRGGIETQEQAVWIGLQLAMALGYLQNAQIVHRDLKPDNVVVDSSGVAKLLDFGVARLKDSRLTEFGVRVGTLRYMSPEQVKSEPLTFSSDMYAFGILLFEMLTFQLPYQADNVEDYFGTILRAEPNVTLLREANVPEELVALIQRCLEKSPEKRYSSFTEIAAVLRRYILPERMDQFTQVAPEAVIGPATAPAGKSISPVWWVGLTVLVLFCAGLAFWMLRAKPQGQTVTPQGSTATPSEVAQEVNPDNMVRVDAGSALLGENAKPVAVRGFYIDVTEVTNASYLEFCHATGRTAPAGATEQPAFPVVNVSWKDAQAYAEWAHKQLPTAEEWEKAARGAKGQKFPWGDVWVAGAANIPLDRAAAKAGSVAPAKSFPEGVSPFGALNMVGNVWEWVRTAASPDAIEFERLAKLFSPPLTRDEPFYQTRGGSYKFVAPPGSEAALVFDSRAMPARTMQPDLGFRCVKEF